jgi:hypothetical protein
MTTQDIIQRMIHERMIGKNIDVVGFVEQLIHLVNLTGEIRCVAVEDDRLRFAIAQEPPVEVELDHASGKLRMICARLAVLSQGARQPNVYGGGGIIEPVALGESKSNGGAHGMERKLQVQFANKPGDVWFSLHCKDSVTEPVFETETQQV